jgi:hypothetical protein
VAVAADCEAASQLSTPVSVARCVALRYYCTSSGLRAILPGPPAARGNSVVGLAWGFDLAVWHAGPIKDRLLCLVEVEGG